MTEKKIVILDYGVGNVRSMKNALSKVGGAAEISHDLSEIRQAAGLIIPGVGAFQQGMKNLTEYNLLPAIYDFIDSQKPVLGVCLGMQLMLDSSDENGYCKGLGIIPGTVERIQLPDMSGLRLPHIAWSMISSPDGQSWRDGILDQSHMHKHFYFVHSYAAKPENRNDILAVTHYGDVEIPAAIGRGNVVGCQFHPEKSGELGLTILANFLRNCGKQ